MPPSPVPCYRSQDRCARPGETGRFWGTSAALVSKKGQPGDKWSVLICAAKVYTIIWPSSVLIVIIAQIVAPHFATLQVTVSWEQW